MNSLSLMFTAMYFVFMAVARLSLIFISAFRLFCQNPSLGAASAAVWISEIALRNNANCCANRLIDTLFLRLVISHFWIAAAAAADDSLCRRRIARVPDIDKQSAQTDVSTANCRPAPGSACPRPTPSPPPAHLWPVPGPSRPISGLPQACPRPAPAPHPHPGSPPAHSWPTPACPGLLLPRHRPAPGLPPAHPWSAPGPPSAHPGPPRPALPRPWPTLARPPPARARLMNASSMGHFAPSDDAIWK